MYFLAKCAEKGCKRSGAVALNPTTKYCNLHSEVKETRVISPEPKDTENRDENGARIEE